MRNIKEIMAEITDAMIKVKAHPMCAKFVIEGGYYIVYYPPGMHPNGARVSKAMGSARALQRLLEVMERHWYENGINP